MARPVEWFQRLPDILRLLKDASPLLDRRQIEGLFAVSPRNAVHLLNRFGATRVGYALVIGREELTTALGAIASEDDYQRHYDRRRRVIAELAGRREDLKLARITLPESAASRLAELRPTIRLTPGHLSIQFDGAVDLLGQLLELSQVIGADFDRFEGLLAQDPLVE